MRRLLYTMIPLLIVGLLAIWGNTILARALDSQLPPLLTRVLGLPVTLAPIKARIVTLSASSDQLIMGDPAAPAVAARGVRVRLSLSHLLEGEIYFLSASADQLRVQPSLWPTSGNPPPQDYQFLEQWLPDKLQLTAGEYITEGGFVYAVRDAIWSRDGTGEAAVQWLQGTGDVQVRTALNSLDELLSLRPVSLQFDVQAAGEQSSQITANVDIAPGEEGGYVLQAGLEAADMSARISAGNSQAWRLPDYSETHIDQLLPDVLPGLTRAYTRSSGDKTAAVGLDGVLPRMPAFEHQGAVTIDQIRVGDELGLDTSFRFNAQGEGIYVDQLSSRGPRGVLGGTVELVSRDDGWRVAMDLAISASEEDGSIGSQFNKSRWLWRSGQASLTGAGATLGEILYTLSGKVKLTGHHRGDEETPVSLAGRLDSEPGDFHLEALEIKLGEGSLTGSAGLSGSDRRKLSIDLVGERMHLGFLYSDSETATVEGLPLPEYLSLFPGIDMDWHLDLLDLRSPNLALPKATATLTRDENGGSLVASAVGVGDGTLELNLSASTPPGGPSKFSLDAKLERVDLPAMFLQGGLFYSRSSGTLSMVSDGHDMQQIFQQMQGEADLSIEMRSDNDWRRNTRSGESLTFSGDARLVVDDKRITGLQIDELDVYSLEQDLTGSLSLVDGRVPWLIADLESQKLNVTRLLDLLPKSSAEADQRNVLQDLRLLGEAQLSLTADTLVIGETPLVNLRAEVLSEPDLLELKQLDFSVHGSELESRGKVTWQGQLASLESSAQLSSANLDQFLLHNSGENFVPVSGSIHIASQGRSVAELLAHVSGNVDLEATDARPSSLRHLRRKLVMKATRLPDGMKADITSLQFGDSELVGRLRVLEGSPAQVSVDLQGGTLSLLAWERKRTVAEKPEQEGGGSMLREAAHTSAELVGDVLRAPLRLLSGAEGDDVGERIFSDDPLPLGALANLDLAMKGRLDKLDSSVITLQNLQFDGHLANGLLDLDLNSDQMNGGSGKVSLQLDSQASPPALEFDADFRDIRGLTDSDTYPRSGVISFQTRGASSAALAGNVNGLIYLELGRGPFDYANSALLNADIATSVFRNLIPGIESQEPTLKCGVVLGAFKDGLGMTPYGYALRTNQANILGRIELNLKTEALQLTLDSRSRKGVGISVGSVFSNAIQVQGTLADPRIVPNSTGILWRSWAAFMTAGLSVVGESVIKRALSSDNPCRAIKKLVTEDLCPKSERAAASDMICPAG